MTDAVAILNGDCRDVLKTLPDESVHCVVTSPPYWGLRNYGVAHQIGLESTLDEHIEVIVGVFREVRRVLRKDGTCWMNYGDCYATAPNGRSAADCKAKGGDDRTFRDKPFSTVGGLLKPKDLCMMPHRIAIALQADGWWVRSDIVWSKPNPMPSSVVDRPTTSHEYVFLLTRSERYYYDAYAIREPCLSIGGSSGNVAPRLESAGERGRTGRASHIASSVPWKDVDGRRNRRTVWEIAPEPTKEAHFATFPTALVKPCILAGTSDHGCCSRCGAPWRRLTEPTPEYSRHLGKDWGDKTKDAAEGRGHFEKADGSRAGQRPVKRGSASITADYVTVGWAQACKCSDAGDPVPCVVLDPFGGSGTVGRVAADLGRKSILIELNPQYVKIAEKKTAQKTLMI